MYKIMFVKAKRDDNETLYQFLTDDENAVLKFETKEELNTQVETMLNEGGYAKSDFIIVNIIDYTISVSDYTDEVETAEEAEPTETDSGDSEEDSETTEESGDSGEETTETVEDSGESDSADDEAVG